jgi:anti-anti-sigma factor
MEIHVKLDGAQGRVAIEGEMTIYTAAELKAGLVDVLSKCNEIEIDLAGVTEIDTAGQQLLVMAKLESLLRDKVLRLVHHSQVVVDIIDLYGLAGFFGDSILMHPQAA